MSVRHLIEPATDMIVAYIKENIAPALVAINASRNAVFNAGVAIPVPRQYFIDKNYMALQPPSIFVVCEDIDFKKDRGANHINATARYGIAAIQEGQTTEQVARITWRYQAALSQILDNLSLTSSDKTFRINVIVTGASFSEVYEEGTQPSSPAYRWRKGVELMCDVEFYEAL